MPFRRLFEIGRKKLPLGVIQLGRSFRNEISPRQGLIRLREFSQAEAQFFLDPQNKEKHPRFSEIADRKLSVVTKKDQEKEVVMTAGQLVKKGHAGEWVAYYLATSIELFSKMGMDAKALRCRQHRDDERSFYSSDTWDVEYKSPTFGNIELVGIAERTDYDLRRHQEVSKQKMEVNIDGRVFIPHVVEVAYGIDRPLYTVLESCARMDGDRMYFSFPPAISPYQVAIFPLVRKDGLPELAMKVFSELNGAGFYALYDEGFIGKLYYRQDQAQVRVKIADLADVLSKVMRGQLAFSKAGKKIKKAAAPAAEASKKIS
jgi:glycyl-tRNA synthetase